MFNFSSGVFQDSKLKKWIYFAGVGNSSKTSISSRIKSVQQETRTRYSVSDIALIPGELPAGRGQVSHHQKGVEQANDRRISGKPAEPVQYGGVRVSNYYLKYI